MLTNEQQAAATNAEIVCRVMACAGSGKTSVLSERVEYLLSQGVQPHEIMAITFTRKAAMELSSRCGGIQAGTFHSVIINKMLSMGLSASVLDEEESNAMLDRCGADLGLALPGGNWVKHSRKHYAKHVKAFREGNEEARSTFVDTYLSRLAMSGEYDFDGVLVKGIELALAGQFSDLKHILIDEAQDCEPLQHTFIDALKQFTPNVMYVGDLAQSIYEWRGAKPSLLANLDVPTYTLSKTFRCPAHVTSIANHLPIDGIEMRSDKRAGQLVTSQSSVAEILPTILSSRSPDDIAILCRYGKQVEEYRDIISSMGHHVAEHKPAPRGPVWTFLKWLDCPGSLSSRRSMQDKWRGVSVNCKPVGWACSDANDTAVCSLMTNWKRRLGDAATVAEALATLDTPAFMLNEEKYFLEQHGDTPLHQLVALETAGGWTGEEGTGINLMTIHASKGLEFPVVILPDLQTWPRGEPKPEDWRLFYVGITRAEEDLVLLSCGPNKFGEYYGN